MRRIALLSVWIGILAGGASRADFVLYDGAQGTLPAQQGWFYRFNPLNPPATQTGGGGLTTLDSMASNATMAGYFTSDPLGTGTFLGFPTLDRVAGYTVRLDARIAAERHASNDRAGFSLQVIGPDLLGIELGFWTDEVWAQADNPLFTHAEGGAANTTRMTRYDLAVSGTTYQLYADGIPLVGGPLRNYSAFGPPYTTPNQVFLGDDTTSAGARIDLAYVSIAPTAIPEPESLGLLALGLALGLLARRRLSSAS